MENPGFPRTLHFSQMVLDLSENVKVVKCELSSFLLMPMNWPVKVYLSERF